ncbi:polysaccharide deacetylase [Kordiimonas sp. SCSIO 12603]|uniref:polysaccharide deacetylase family protein n=1 Tax=Kordiimonas sp. SCSIO 12603 TaxID=2829596 RepID=UPI002105C287|nr:polysaccharide deacetylase [Kordiimonas sp. SCSIO 12603]UTW60342.1 polysaccharide deacetylase [Kordiimonas sp. SCSIO 12603]
MIKNKIAWPKGAKCAAAITFDIDADSLIHISKPNDGHDRLCPLSMGLYGPTAAMHRILDTYKKFGIRQTFFIPAWCMEQYPEMVENILEGGHEIAHHGYIHEDPTTHSTEEQRYWFEKALDVHVRMTGSKPKGYRAPVYNVNMAVVDLLIEHGFLYESSMMADDTPYILQTDKGRLVEAPVHWAVDDWPPFAHYPEIDYMMHVQPASHGLQGFWEEFEAQHKHGGFWMSIWHPFLTGRLSRWSMVEEWLERVLERGDVWFAPVHEIASYVQSQHETGAQDIRVDRLPYYPQAQFPAAREHKK